MKGYSTISAILSDIWLINPNYAYAHLDLASSLLDGKLPILQQGQADQSKAINVASRNNIGVINITGPVFKYDGACGEPGYVSYGEQLIQLQLDDNIEVIVLNIDCPGGQGSGLRTLAYQIRNSSKPVIGFINDGMCCSAGYWLLAACSWIIASQPTDRVGSIGAYMILLNFLKAAENNGQPLIEVYSSLSDEKNLSVKEALAGKPEKLIAELDELVTVYHNDVREWRGDKINLNIANPYRGADYPAQSPTGIDALSIGLIDEIGTIDLAFDRATSIVSNPNLFTDMSKFTRLANLCGKPAAEVTPAQLSLINAEFTEAGITEFGLYSESVITEGAKATTDLATANARIKELEAQAPAATLTARVSELEKEVSDKGAAFTKLEGTAKASADKVTELEGTLATSKTELKTAQDRITELETGKPAGGNNGKQANSKGDANTDPNRELNSWEVKALKKVGSAK